MRVALVYDRLNKIGGAEQVLREFHTLFPDAEWYTSLWDPSRATFSRNWPVHASWLNRLPWLRTHHEWLPWLMPFVFESFDFSSYDLVISIGSAEAKGILTRPGTFHLHYCLTPTRYLYSHSDVYLRHPLQRLIAGWLRRWDLVAATRPDTMIAISTLVKNRIKQYYNRESEIIFPPVDTQKFAAALSRPSSSPASFPYFLVVSRLVPYKKISLLVQVFNQLPSHHLIIIGTGSQLAALRRLARSNTHFLGQLPDSAVVAYFTHCQAYLQANEEDFGIAMCESLAAGKPVIAYGHGGVTDIIKHGITGILVDHADVESFISAIRGFDPTIYKSRACRDSVTRFEPTAWRQAILKKVRQVCR